MDNNYEWMQQQIAQLQENEPAYEKRAFLTAFADVVAEQAKRQTQMQGEIDGRAWDHTRW
ncbi:hypothetical protein IV38_GL001144 [Lactobacillus selangorensis]|uniref:Uncharacterized protein n=1 Tax=Lactobacillus selangorensis TaxID=81857 RepID=A0A0R2FMH2_9LACO|nr:hypothetical protein [Lactobacillus selangorensis]KRN28934.1 hypothetical protein IV38_GL001144 [Lactobacillus selangorensis]KRN32656.1 hypothetical protein IV40_GL000709 [Lactobacillus selangorensis]